MLDFCPNSVSTATFPGQGYPFLKKKLQVQDIWGILGLVGHWGGPEVPQGCWHGSCDCAARLQVWHDQSHCDLIPQVWHDVLDCNLIPQVFRQNTLRGGVPTAERRNRCFKKLWQGSERGAPWTVEIIFCWKQLYDVGVNLHVSKHYLTILEQKWTWLLLYSHVYSKQSYESPKALHSISVFVERLVQLLSHSCVLTC